MNIFFCTEVFKYLLERHLDQVNYKIGPYVLFIYLFFLFFFFFFFFFLQSKSFPSTDSEFYVSFLKHHFIDERITLIQTRSKP